MAHHHHGRRDEYEEERTEEQFDTQDQYGNQGYGETVDTVYETEGGGYGRRQENYQVNPDAGYAEASVVDEQRLQGIENTRRQETRYQRTEYGGEAAAALGAGLALYERHEEKVDPLNARRHKTEEEIAEGVTVGGLGTAFYGHHEKKNDEEALEEEETGKKKHHWF